MSNIAIILLPFLILIGTMIVCLLLEAFNISKGLTPPITIIGGFLALYSVILSVNGDIVHLFGNPDDFLERGSILKAGNTTTVGEVSIAGFCCFFPGSFFLQLY